LNVSGARRCLLLATEARGALMVSADSTSGPGEGVEAKVLLADQSEVTVYVLRDGLRWVVSSRFGEWEATDQPDCVLHAIACAMGDPGADP